MVFCLLFVVNNCVLCKEICSSQITYLLCYIVYSQPSTVHLLVKYMTVLLYLPLHRKQAIRANSTVNMVSYNNDTKNINYFVFVTKLLIFIY